MEDNALEASENFIVTLQSSDSAVVINNNITTVTINDNDGMITITKILHSYFHLQKLLYQSLTQSMSWRVM